MSLYSEIKKFDGLFYGIRLHETFIIIDLKLPKKWEDKKILEQSKSNNQDVQVQIKVNNQDDNYKLISFYTVFDEINTDILVKEINKIIKWNKDLEEKNNLLNTKMLELQKVFQENNLNDLRDLNINFQPKLVIDEAKNSGLVQQGDIEGPIRDKKTQI
tara:strand:- start:140 stop:616 length:477 start_codon:yes stop_codon:yes gene_type:complete